MKRAAQSLPLTVLLVASSNAQITVTNNPSDPGVVTSYYSICPTDSSTTITLDTTTTICPGAGCGGTTTMFVGPTPITSVSPDGRTTVWEEYPLIAPCPCEGGVCDATYTVTRQCPCTAPVEPSSCPEGFTTTAMACDECAQNGGPSTITVTTPVPNGPYASQTPAMGTPYNGASASAGASAYASAGPNGAAATAGSNAVANAGNGNAAANSDANANANANSASSPDTGDSDNGASGAGAPNANANGNSNANADSDNNDSPEAPAPVPAPAPAAPSRIDASASMTMNDTGVYPPIEPYEGSADRTVYAISAVFAGAVGCLAFFL